MPAMDDTSNHEALWPGCRMHFIVETPATKSGLWFPLRDMAVGDYLELVDDDEVKAARRFVSNWHQGHDSRFTVRTDRADPDIHICRRVK